MPISNLYEDILMRIFLMCSKVDSENGDYSPILDWDWITVTHVCGYWRTLAISYPLLWRRPTLARHSRDRLEAFFARSHNAPLVISTSYRCKILNVDFEECTACQDNVVLALHHLSRIRHLSVHSTNSEMLTEISGKPAPLLQDLQLDCNTAVLGKLPVLLLSDFVTQVQSMKSLTLRGFYLQYDSQMLRGLECLNILHYSSYSHPGTVALCYPTLYELVDILSTSPSLQVLELYTIRGTTGLQVLQENYMSRKIQLSSLCSLNIEEIEIGVFEELLKCIDIPIGIDVTIGLRFTGINDFDRILDILMYIGEYNYGESLDVRQLDGLINLSLDVDLETTPVIPQRSLHTYLTLIQVDEGGKRLNENVLNENDIDYEGVSEMTMNLIRFGHWNNVTSLRLTVSNHYSVVVDREWRTFLDAFKSLENLNIRMHDLAKLWDDLFDHATELESILILEKSLLSSLTLPPIHDDSLQEPQSTYILPVLNKLSLDISSVSHIPAELLLCMEARSEGGQAVRNLRICSRKRFPKIDDDDNWHSELRRYVDHIKLFYW